MEPIGVSAVLVLKIHLLPTMLHSSEAYCHPRVMTLMIYFGVETFLVIDLVDIRLRKNFVYEFSVPSVKRQSEQYIMVSDFTKTNSWAFFPNMVLQEW